MFYIFSHRLINRNPFDSKKGRTHFTRKSLKIWQNPWLYQNVRYRTYGWFWVFLDALGHLGHYYNHIRTHSEWNNRWFRQFATGRVRMWSTLYCHILKGRPKYWHVRVPVGARGCPWRMPTPWRCRGGHRKSFLNTHCCNKKNEKNKKTFRK